jgi:hypothetical protein
MRRKRGKRKLTTQRRLSVPERLYRILESAIDGGRIPQIVQTDTPTLLSLTLYSEHKLVAIALELLRMQFRQKEGLIQMLSEIQARAQDLCVFESILFCAWARFARVSCCTRCFTTPLRACASAGFGCTEAHTRACTCRARSGS